MSLALERFLYLHFGTSFLIFLAIIVTSISVQVRGNSEFRRQAPALQADSCAHSNWRHLGWFFICAYLVFYSAAIVSWEQFTFWDDPDVFSAALRGQVQNYAYLIWPEQGRFLPLICQEFNLLSHLSTSAKFYHLFAALQVGVLCWIIRVIFRRKVFLSSVAILCVTLEPSFVQAMFALTYSERNVIFLLGIFIVASRRFVGSGGRAAAAAAVVASATAAFYKETGIVPFAAWAGWMLARSLRLGGVKDIDAEDRRARFLALWIAGVAAVALGLYVALTFGRVGQNYLEGRQASMTIILVNRVLTQPWFIAFMSAIICRIVQPGVRRAADPLWDAIAAAGVSVTLVYLVLRLPWDYYFAPGIFLCWLYAVHIGHLLFTPITLKWPRDSWRRTAAGSIAAVLILVQAPKAFDTMRIRKETVHSRADAARFLHEAYLIRKRANVKPATISVFSLEKSAYSATMFYAYLDALVPDTAFGLLEAGPSTGRSRSTPPRCVNFMPLPCDFRPGPKPGDFVVAFGSDDELAGLQRNYALLYASAPIGFWKNTQRVFIFLAG